MQVISVVCKLNKLLFVDNVRKMNLTEFHI